MTDQPDPAGYYADLDPAVLAAALSRAPGARASFNDRVAEAERLHAAREAARVEAEDLARAATDRYHNDRTTHRRTELAARVAEHYLGEEAREPALMAASVALELAERDRPTAEAKLARVEALAAGLLASMSPGHNAAARAIVEALKHPRP